MSPEAQVAARLAGLGLNVLSGEELERPWAYVPKGPSGTSRERVGGVRAYLAEFGTTVMIRPAQPVGTSMGGAMPVYQVELHLMASGRAAAESELARALEACLSPRMRLDQPTELIEHDPASQFTVTRATLRVY